MSDRLEIHFENGVGWFVVRGNDVLAGPFRTAKAAHLAANKMERDHA